MTLEELIRSRLLQSEVLRERLVQYAGDPAIFYQQAPDDRAAGWPGRQYPRIQLLADRRADPERQSSGVLEVGVYCIYEGVQPESLEPAVREALSNMFLWPDDEPPYSLAWARTVALDPTTDGQVLGVVVQFDLFAFPLQETSDPDPVTAMHEYIRAICPEGVLVGRDRPGECFEPSGTRPAFYVRLGGLQALETTNTVVWMGSNMILHIFSGDAKVQLCWIKALVDRLAEDGEVTMLDKSPMFVQGIKANNAWDPLTTGQIQVQVRFGILRKHYLKHYITGISMK